MRSRTDRTICGTCEFWTGNRQPVFDKNGNPKIDIIDDSGFCQNVNSNFLDTIRKCGYKCCGFSKWTEIL